MDRSFQLRWFWKYDIAAGAEFRARLRLSNDDVTSLDLTNPLVEYNFTVSGAAADFEMFETTVDLPNGVRSFDLTFISGGALSAIGTIYIDDISAAIVTAPVLPGRLQPQRHRRCGRLRRVAQGPGHDTYTQVTTTCGVPTSAKPPAAAQVPVRMPPFPNRRL